MVLDNFDGGIIDYNSVILVINKLRLYRENEEKIIAKIKNSLIALDNHYISDNSGLLKDKKDSLYNGLDIMMENIDGYITFLTNIVNSYINNDEMEMRKYNDGIN